MSERERELLVEQAASAHRTRDPLTGRARPHPAWLDLDEDGRLEAFDAAAETRALEAALDPESLSSTARAVLKRIRAQRP